MLSDKVGQIRRDNIVRLCLWFTAWSLRMDLHKHMTIGIDLLWMNDATGCIRCVGSVSVGCVV